MDKRLACYSIRASTAAWPRHVIERFPGAQGRFGALTFDDGSDKDLSFQECIAAMELSVIRTTHIKCTGQALFRHPFHYLSVRDDRDYEKNDFMDERSKCTGDQGILCRQGVKQKERIMMDPRKSKELDIMLDPRWLKPCILLVARGLKDRLEAMGATGCEFVACLEAGRQYSDEERDLSARKEIDDAKYFQLVITARARQPKRLGKLRRISQQCSRCGTVHLWDAEEIPGYFKAGDLEDADLQSFDRYQCDDGTEFVGTIEVPVISARTLRLFLEHGIRGLRRYLVDPPIQYGVVDVRD